MKEINGSEADVVKQKICPCFVENKGCEITCLLEVGYLVHPEDLKDFSVSDIMCYKYARFLSCDVERQFPRYKLLFHDD
jgi:hypothetical protein